MPIHLCNQLHNTTTVLWPGLPGWTGTKRNTHRPTILMIIKSIGVNCVIQVGRLMASAEHEAKRGVWGQSHQRGPEQSPWSGGQGAKPPWSWKHSVFHKCKWGTNLPILLPCKLLKYAFWATICKMVRPMLLDCCLSVLSVTLVYCGQTVGWINMPLGMEVGLRPGHIVLGGDPAPPT